MNDRKILTRPFTVQSGDYFAVLIRQWVPRWGWVMLLPVSAAVFAAVLLSDERYLLVALMLVFIVIPMVMTFLYTYYMLTPEVRRAILPQQAEISPGNWINLIPEGDEKPALIPWEKVERVKFTSRYLLYFIRGERMHFAMIPYTALPEGTRQTDLM